MSEQISLVEAGIKGVFCGGTTMAPQPTRFLMEEVLESAVGSLEPREREILRARFGRDDQDIPTLEEIGKRMGISRERVRQLEARALKKLRDTLPAQRLHPILEP